MNQSNNKHDQNDPLVEEVAFLLSKGYSPYEIGLRKGWRHGEARVARLKREAIDKRLLEPLPPKFNTKAVPPSRLAELQALDGGEELRVLLLREAEKKKIPPERQLRKVTVYPTNIRATSDMAWDRRLQGFGRAAALALSERLAHCERIGVTCGKTLEAVIAALGGVLSNRKTRIQRAVVALCGEPFASLIHGSHGASSSALAEALSDHLGTARLLAMRGVPAFIPPQFQEPEILSFLRECTHYGEIFGIGPEPDGKSISAQLDAVLTSVGTCGDGPGLLAREYCKYGDIELSELAEIAAGDLGGFLLERPGCTEGIARLRRIWTGIDQASLENIAARAGTKRKPGVILFAIGVSKAAPTLAAVQSGLVNELVIDQDLRDAMHRILITAKSKT